MYLELNGYDLSISEIVGLVTDQMCLRNWTEGMFHMRRASFPAGLLVGFVATSWWFQRCSMSMKNKTGMKIPHGFFISHGLKPCHGSLDFKILLNEGLMGAGKAWCLSFRIHAQRLFRGLCRAQQCL